MFNGKIYKFSKYFCYIVMGLCVALLCSIEPIDMNILDMIVMYGILLLMLFLSSIAVYFFNEEDKRQASVRKPHYYDRRNFR